MTANSAPASAFPTSTRASVLQVRRLRVPLAGRRRRRRRSPPARSPAGPARRRAPAPRGAGSTPCPGPSGGSPRSARMLRTPAPAYCPTTWRSSATDEPTQVRWPTGVSVVSAAIRSVTRTVRSRVGAARAVGHRDERGGQRLQLADRLPQRPLALVGLGREELEREASAPAPAGRPRTGPSRGSRPGRFRSGAPCRPLCRVRPAPDLPGRSRGRTLDDVTTSPLDAEDLGARVQTALDDVRGQPGRQAAATSAPDAGPVRRDPCRRCCPAASGCGRRSATGAGAAPAAPDGDADRPGRGRARAPAGLRAHPRRRDGRLRHPARPAGRAPPLRAAAPRRRLAGTAGARSGSAAAILLGDLCLSWADELLYGSRAAPTRRCAAAKPVFDEMRTELMAGQYLDLLEQATRRRARSKRAMRVRALQEPPSTPIERPLHLGAALAGAARGTAAGVQRATACRSARRSSCATTCSACSATRPRPASRPATTCARASARVLVAIALAAAAPAAGRAAAPSTWATRVWTRPASTTCASVIATSGALARVEDLIARLTGAGAGRAGAGRSRAGGRARRLGRWPSSRTRPPCARSDAATRADRQRPHRPRRRRRRRARRAVRRAAAGRGRPAGDRPRARAGARWARGLLELRRATGSTPGRPC